MKHYYNAKINSSKKVKHNHNPKPVYILNPQFIGNQKNNNISQNISYSIRYQVHTAERTKMYNINSIPNNMFIINDQINNNQINNININSIPYYSQGTTSNIISNSNTNANNEQIILNGLNGYNQKDNYNINQNLNNIYYNTNQNDIV